MFFKYVFNIFLNIFLNIKKNEFFYKKQKNKKMNNVI